MYEKKKWIIYGAGKCAYNRLMYYGNENVYCFVDTYKKGEVYGKIIITMEELKTIYNPEKYNIDIAIANLDFAWEVMKQLENINIKINCWGGIHFDKLMHVYGVNNEISYDIDIDSIHKLRAISTIDMLKDTFKQYDCYYIDVYLDFYIYLGDNVFDASRICELLGRDYIFAYSEIYGINNVISIPDYKFMHIFYDNLNYYNGFWDKVENLKKYEDNRAFWAGNVDNDKTRRILVALSESHKDKLFVNGYVFRNGVIQGKMIDAKEWVKFKYIIDIRGWGWTDRVKYLLAMKRPLLLVDRPYKEYYFKYLQPMVHYVPVKEDLSDLFDKIDMLDRSPELYDELVNNAYSFAKKHFVKEEVCKEMHAKIYNYGRNII